MCHFNPKNDGRRIDPCLEGLIAFLNDAGIETVACCCGHGVYPLSIVVRTSVDMTMEICSGTTFVGRKKKYYKKDENGVYFIPGLRKVI